VEKEKKSNQSQKDTKTTNDRPKQGNYNWLPLL
jgi:hypothetical protein